MKREERQFAERRGGEYAGHRMLFLPGGQWQVPVIRLAQEMGFYVLCADGTESPPGFAVADYVVRSRLQDIPSLVAAGRQHAVSAVMTEQTDFAVPIVARVSKALGLVGLPVDVADAATNKGLMRERVAAAGLAQPQFRVCRTQAEVQSAVEQLGLPLFCKPIDGQSSRGVGVLSSAEPGVIAAMLDRALCASTAGQAIVEQRIEGIECTVEGFVQAGEPVTLAISDKQHYADLAGVARTLSYPAAFAPATLERIARANEAVVRALGIPFGITHAEFIVDARREVFLVEAAARGGGSRITTDIVPAVSGFHPVRGLIRQLMGEAVQVPALGRRAAQLRFLRFPVGRRIARFRNLDELRQRPGVIEILLDVAPGEIVPPVTDDRSRHGHVIAAGDSRAEAVRVAGEIERELDVEFVGEGTVGRGQVHVFGPGCT